MILIEGEEILESTVKAGLKALKEIKKKSVVDEKDVKDIALLTESIKDKWEPILHLGKEDLGARSCVLCKVYLYCKGCPIADYVKDTGCDSTPYAAWESHNGEAHDRSSVRVYVGCKECVELCSKEVGFLKEVRDWVINGRSPRLGD